MRISYIVDWDVGVNVYSNIDRDLFFELYSGAGVEVKIEGGEEIKLDIKGEVDSYNDSSVDKYVKYEVNVNIDDNVN